MDKNHKSQISYGVKSSLQLVSSPILIVPLNKYAYETDTSQIFALY